MTNNNIVVRSHARTRETRETAREDEPMMTDEMKKELTEFRRFVIEEGLLSGRTRRIVKAACEYVFRKKHNIIESKKMIAETNYCTEAGLRLAVYALEEKLKKVKRR